MRKDEGLDGDAQRISQMDDNIANTILSEFQELYSLYQIMKHS